MASLGISGLSRYPAIDSTRGLRWASQLKAANTTISVSGFALTSEGSYTAEYPDFKFQVKGMELGARPYKEGGGAG